MNSKVLRNFVTIKGQERILKFIDHIYIQDLHKIIDNVVFLEYVPYMMSLYDINMKIIRQLCFAVRYLHNNNIIHTNIDVYNVLITADGDVRLAGFEKAGNIDNEITRMPTIRDPPEVLLGLFGFTKNQDVWRIGVAVYEAVTGKIPFATDAINVINSVRNPDYSQISDDIVKFLQSIFVLRVDKRPTIQSLIKSHFPGNNSRI